MKKQYIIISVLVLVVVGFLVSKNSKPVSTEKIRIGAVISLTGFASSFGEMAQKGINLAVSEINANGGVDGRELEVIFEDDRTDPKTAAGLYQKMTGIDKVDAIIGSNFDFVTQPIFGLAKTGTTVVVSPSNPRIAGTFDTNAQSFVMMSDFNKIVLAFKDYLTKEQYTKPGIVRFDSAFSAEIAKTLSGIVVDLGKPAIFEETYKQIGNNDFRTTILKLKNAKVDLVFLDMIAQDPSTFLIQAKHLGYKPKVITHVGIIDAMALPALDKKIFNGVVVLNWDVTTEAFAKAFEAKYQIQPSKSANRAYDAVYILSESIAKSKDKADVAKYLESTSFTTPNGRFAFTPEHAAGSTVVGLKIVKDGVLLDYN
jgi:branched-chain amino acid transport system substrate-binding protein